MQIFDEFQRTFSEKPDRSEPIYSLLNRSSLPEFNRIRNLINDWFGHYPEEEKKKLQSRFRSNDNSKFNSASFELILHEMLLRFNCHVEIEPEIPGTTKKPEFRVTPPNGKTFIMEAVNSTDLPDEEAGEKSRIKQLYDFIDRINLKHFYIGIELHGISQEQPSANRISALLTNWLLNAEPKTIHNSDDEQIGKQLKDFGFDATITAIPKNHHTESDKFIGWSMDTRRNKVFINPKKAIKSKLKKKATRYGNHEIPYVIAINILGDFSGFSIDNDINNLLDALIGTSTTLTHNKTIDPKQYRKKDGFFINDRGPINTRVSGVLATFDLSFYSLARANIFQFNNPFAQIPFGDLFNTFPRLDLKIINQAEEKIYYKPIEGTKLAEFFSLPLSWPLMELQDKNIIY